LATETFRRGQAVHVERTAEIKFAVTRFQNADGLRESNQIDTLRRLFGLVLSPAAAERSATVVIDRYGSLARATSVSKTELIASCRLAPKVADLLREMRNFSEALLREDVEKGPVLCDVATLYDYLRASLAGNRKEVARLLLLDQSGRLIADIVHATGTANFVPISPAMIARDALTWNAAAIVLVHNHPMNTVRPSDADVAKTEEVRHALAAIDVKLLDHIIVTDERCLSLKENCDLALDVLKKLEADFDRPNAGRAVHEETSIPDLLRGSRPQPSGH
jgi:DNA repair protein RadC